MEEPANRERRDGAGAGDGDLGDMLQEVRVLLPGAQTLTAFLIILPFNQGFAQIAQSEKNLYVATFLCSLASLVLFAAPAAQHRLERPLRDRVAFKQRANRLVVAGLMPLSVALTLASYLVMDHVLHVDRLSWAVAGLVALLIGTIWWLIPLRAKPREAGG